MHKYGYVFQELPIHQIQRDPDQPRRDTESDLNRLLVSIRQYGIEQPITVSEHIDGRFIIIDGHRRYNCADKLNYEKVPCRVYPKLQPGEFETRRFEAQNNRRAWRPLERSDALERIKSAMGFGTNKQLADHLGMTETLVGNSLQLRKQKMGYIELMEKHNLNESHRLEFVRLKPKIRKIKDFEADEIIINLFERVQHKVIRSSRDFRKLGRIFLRATANEQELYNYLSDPDMTVSELEQRTLQSGFSLHIEQVIQKIASKRKEGVAFSSQERAFLEQLRDLLNKVL
jgi:ParB/RepB/Spo0J family partition protein